MDKYQRALNESMDTKLQKFGDKLKYNRTVDGMITEIINETTYKVKIYGDEEELRAIDNKQYEVGDIVRIIVYNDNYSDKAIWHKRV